MSKKKKKLQKPFAKFPINLPPNLLESFKEIIKDLPEDKRPSALKKIDLLYQDSYYGIIPSPDDLEKYNKIIPNGADRIMAMAEKPVCSWNEIRK